MAPAPAEVWSTGDYAAVCDRMIPDLGARLVELAGVQAGDDVLDVATGTGNAALPAAAAGAIVTALDITPSLLEIGAQRAGAAGLEVKWVHGDAQALPFPNASFDRVLSCVGVQFCPSKHAAAAELIRVSRPGGRVALIAWTPEGFLGKVLGAVSRATGAGPRPAPLDWGSEQGVRELFTELAADIQFRRSHVAMPAESASAWVDYMATAYGPMARARVALEKRDAWQPLRDQLVEIANAHDTRERLLPHARAVLAALDAGLGELEATRRAARATLRVGLATTAVVPLVGETLRRFAADRPDVHLAVSNHGMIDPSAGLRAGTVDVGFVRPPFTDDGFSPPRHVHTRRRGLFGRGRGRDVLDRRPRTGRGPWHHRLHAAWRPAYVPPG
jgi:ubiquinone/menaquinone biosynthesis C-methylase UbiE